MIEQLNIVRETQNNGKIFTFSVQYVYYHGHIVQQKVANSFDFRIIIRKPIYCVYGNVVLQSYNDSFDQNK